MTTQRRANAPAGGVTGPGSGHFDMPDLRLLSASSLVLHEHADEKRVARLVERLRSDGYLKNPPVVAPLPGADRYVVLDGANRTTAVQRLGCPDILAQVVDYASNQVELYTWYHLVAGRSPAAFLAEIAAVGDLTLKPVPLELARSDLQRRAIVGYIEVPDGGANPTVYAVHGLQAPEHYDTHATTALLNSIVDTYKDDPAAVIHRVSSDNLEELLPYYDDVSGLVVFPPYSAEDIIELAEAGTKVPTGITRHIISRRALRINAPMSLLCGKATLPEKNAWWHEQVKRKLASNEIRLYQESTYLFDE